MRPDKVTPKAIHSVQLKVPGRPCTSLDMTFEGKCLNCGGINVHAQQPKTR
jgi:hypothetical protein